MYVSTEFFLFSFVVSRHFQENVRINPVKFPLLFFVAPDGKLQVSV